MLVGERMTRDPVTIREDESIDDGLHLMRERKVRRLPVMDQAGQMVGMVSDKDLLHAAPSPATSLSVYELHYLLAKLKIKQIMSNQVIWVSPDTPIEEAARIMADNKIGGLPVVQDEKLVGIITETDIFRVLVELLGARTAGLRVTLSIHEGKGVLAKLARALADLGANIVSIVTYSDLTTGERLITMKISDADPAATQKALEGLGAKIVDFRTA